MIDPCAGLAPGAPRARLDCPDNLVARHVIDYGDVDGAFAKAAHRIAERFRLHKGGGHSIETRGVVAALRSRRRRADGLGQHPDAAPGEAVLVAALGLAEHECA